MNIIFIPKWYFNNCKAILFDHDSLHLQPNKDTSGNGGCHADHRKRPTKSKRISENLLKTLAKPLQIKLYVIHQLQQRPQGPQRRPLARHGQRQGEAQLTQAVKKERERVQTKKLAKIRKYNNVTMPHFKNDKTK